MAGFCPDDWHGTTDRDIQQQMWGEDFWLYYPGAVFDRGAVERKRGYVIHDAAIAQAKAEGLALHLLSDAEQSARMDAAEAASPAPKIATSADLIALGDRSDIAGAVNDKGGGRGA